MRFERGVDIEGVVGAQARAALLMQKLAGGKIREGRVDVYPSPVSLQNATLRISRLNQVLGCSLSAEQIEGYLLRLGMNVSGLDGGKTFCMEVPSFRPAVRREIDLIEEVVRLHGFDNIKVTSPAVRVSPVRFTPRQSAVRKVKDILSHLGCSEILTYSFIDPESAVQFQSAFAGEEMKTVSLSNPISSDMGVMRPSLVPGLIQSAVRNLSRGQKQVKIFELGHIFLYGRQGKREEKIAFAGLAAGVYENNVWKPTGQTYDYYDLKGILGSVAAQFKLELTEQPASGRPYMLRGKSVELLVGGLVCGYFGELSPGVIRQYELPKCSVVFEMDFDRMVDALSGPVRFAALPKYPETYRDISMLIDQIVSSGEVSDQISKAGAPLLKRVELYDHFDGKKIQKGKKSLTYALTFQSTDKTLTDEEVNPIFEKIVKTLSSQLGATLRD